MFIILLAAGVRGHYHPVELHVQQQLYGGHESQAHSHHHDFGDT